MHQSIALIALILAGSLIPGFASAASDADKTAARATKAAKPDAAPAATEIAYDDLGAHVGERIAVHTTFKSTRVGTLAKFTKIELTLSIDTASGPTELTIPKDTVVSIVPAQAPAPVKH
jgi:hypothetical protein